MKKSKQVENQWLFIDESGKPEVYSAIEKTGPTDHTMLGQIMNGTAETGVQAKFGITK